MTLYDILIYLSQERREKIYVNLYNKSLKIGKKVIIDNGEVQQYEIISGDDKYEFDCLIKDKLNLDELYEQYKTSMPSEHDNGKHYFKALSVSELTDAQLVLGMPRFEARIRLEAYVLLASIVGNLKWQNPNHWYWVGKDKDFVILRKYI